MSRKRPTADQMGKLMSQPHFRRDNDDALVEPSNTPITSTPMLVDVDKLEAYDRNPRRSTNAKYDELKAYIRQNGFNQVLAITQRPDTDQPDVYMIGVGGNTRLAIMQELWAETGDERFKQIRCQFEPWVDESHTLVAHIQDNDLRGDLTFIDRASAIQELRALLEAEAGESLSQRALRDRLSALGYQIGRTMIGWYDYTVDTLYPLIPTVLQAGLGRTTIMKIHELQRAFGKSWASMGLGDADAAQSLFEQTLQRHDGDMLDLDALRHDLEEELSISADCDMQRASLEFGGALYGRSDSEAGAPPEPPGSGSEEQSSSAPESGPADDAGATPPSRTEATTQQASAATPPATNTADASRNKPSTKTSGAASDTGSVETSGSASASPDQRPSGTPEASPALPGDLKSLRARTWTLASQIAQGSRLGDIVQPLPTGLGFLVGPIPVEVQQSWHPDIGRSAMCVWWHLATLAEQFARHGNACEVMPADWTDRPIGQAMRQARDGQQPFSRWQWEQADRDLFADVPPLEPNDMGPMLYQSWTNQRWADWVQLVDTYREIYRATGDAPWGNE